MSFFALLPSAGLNGDLMAIARGAFLDHKAVTSCQGQQCRTEGTKIHEDLVNGVERGPTSQCCRGDKINSLASGTQALTEYELLLLLLTIHMLTLTSTTLLIALGSLPAGSLLGKLACQVPWGPSSGRPNHLLPSTQPHRTIKPTHCGLGGQC